MSLTSPIQTKVMCAWSSDVAAVIGSSSAGRSTTSAPVRGSSAPASATSARVWALLPRSSVLSDIVSPLRAAGCATQRQLIHSSIGPTGSPG